MIILVTALLLYIAMYAGILRYHRNTGRLYTFLVDPPTMFVVGLLTAMFGLITRKGWKKLPLVQYEKRRTRINRGLGIFLLLFWCAELSSYFNIRYASFLDFSKHPFDPTRTGNDFMVNGYVEWLTGPLYHGPFPLYDHWWSWPILVAMLYLQVLALKFGREMGYQTAFFNDPDNWSDKKPGKTDGT